MRSSWVALVFVGGCHDPRFVDCVIACTATTGCPPGLTCGAEGLCRDQSDAPACSATLPGSRRIAVARVGDAGGSVVSSPPGIDCGATCAHAFPVGALVTLRATADPGTVFAGWGAPCAGLDPCTVEVTSDLAVSARFACTGSRTFELAGVPEILSVPPCATAITVDARGASGAPGRTQSGGTVGTPGAGGRVQAMLPVAAGDTFVVRVGGAGSSEGGFNGGGAGGMSTLQRGGGGGGASDLRRNGDGPSHRVVVAAGGGGAASCRNEGFDGGDGGGLDGGNVAACDGATAVATGATQSAGGRGGSHECVSAPGTSGVGGAGCLGGGGGGGGYFGGGGGAWHGGGGGSSFATSTATKVVHSPGSWRGDGRVTVTW